MTRRAVTQTLDKHRHEASTDVETSSMTAGEL
jgi:hypothetical protein